MGASGANHGDLIVSESGVFDRLDQLCQAGLVDDYWSCCSGCGIGQAFRLRADGGRVYAQAPLALPCATPDGRRPCACARDRDLYGDGDALGFPAASKLIPALEGALAARFDASRRVAAAARRDGALRLRRRIEPRQRARANRCDGPRRRRAHALVRHGVGCAAAAAAAARCDAAHLSFPPARAGVRTARPSGEDIFDLDKCMACVRHAIALKVVPATASVFGGRATKRRRA